MNIVVTADGNDLDAPFVPVFGRCPVFVFVDTETMAVEAKANDAVGAMGGAGIQAAQFVADKRVGAVITGSVGPNAHQVLAAAGVPIYVFGGSTVREAVEEYRQGRLVAVSGPTGPAHAGMGRGRGRRGV